MTARNFAAKLAFVTLGAAATTTVLAGTASAEVTEGAYTAATYPLAPSLWVPVTADAAVIANTLTIAGVPVAAITPTDDGGTAVVAGQQYTLTPGPDAGDFTITDEAGTTQGWILAR